MVEPLGYQEILNKLLEKTRAGRLDWQAEGVDRFTSRMDERYVFAVWKTEGGYGASIEDRSGLLPPVGQRIIFSVTADDEIYFAEPERKQTFDTLSDLYELARRKALDVPGMLSQVAELLDKI